MLVGLSPICYIIECYSYFVSNSPVTFEHEYGLEPNQLVGRCAFFLYSFFRKQKKKEARFGWRYDGDESDDDMSMSRLFAMI